MMSGPGVNDDDIRDGRSEQLITPEVVPVVAIRPTTHSTQGSRNFDAVAITVDEPPAAVALPIGLGRVLPMGGRDLDPETVRQIQLIIVGTKCCVGCLNLLNLAYLGAGLAFLALSPDARDDPCGQPVYTFNAVALAISSIVSMLGLLSIKEIFRIMARIEDPSLPELGSFYTRLNQVVAVVVNYAIFIYGSVVWQRLSNLENACRRGVMMDFPDLYAWYSITFWMSVVFIASQVVAMCNKKRPREEAQEDDGVVIDVQEQGASSA